MAVQARTPLYLTAVLCRVLLYFSAILALRATKNVNMHIAANDTRLFQLSKAAKKAVGSGARYLQEELHKAGTTPPRPHSAFTNRALAAMSET
jgi:hypothetical protein